MRGMRVVSGYNFDLNRHNRIISGILVSSLFIVLLVYSGIFTGVESGYSPTSYKCISCHNDTGYPMDTDNDSVSAPYKRPHNGTVMCETCHNQNPHTLTFIQPDGRYQGKPTAASCPECHQAGIPAGNNSNFTTAFLIPNPVRHSSDPANGSLWGNHWTNTSTKSACIYCHNKTLHNVKPLGRILEWSPAYVMKSPIGNGSSCAGCHYKEDANYTAMVSAFRYARLEIPSEITNGTDWNGTSANYFNHSIESYTDSHCKQCHGSLLSRNATMSEFVHNVGGGAGEACIGCHSSLKGNYTGLNMASFGSHLNINRSDGDNLLTNEDCKTCHYNFNYTDMMKSGFTTLTYICTDCHIQGNYSAPVIINHKPPKTPLGPGSGVTTSAYCSTCHNNSINDYGYSVNASVSHYGTNASLIKPTVNSTSSPVFGFVNSAEAVSYNKPCSDCHNPPNLSYGTPVGISNAHTRTGTCNQCHVNTAGSDLHNGSLGLPVTFYCSVCHTTYADRYKAPNLTGTDHRFINCVLSNCHGADSYGSPGQLDNPSDHNYDVTKPSVSSLPYTDTVYLNGVASTTVPKGAAVAVTSRIYDSYVDPSSDKASRVRGAEYYIGVDPGQGKGTPMNAADGVYDAVNGAWESVTGTIDTGSLPAGTYTVYVRGMDIGKQWSSTRSATLTVTPQGYINGTVTSGGQPLAGVTVSVTGGNTITYTNGNYSLVIESGTHNVTASKKPEYYDNTSNGIIVTPGNTTILDIILTLKPLGNITGTVKNK